MAKYVVKNERGEYMCQDAGGAFWGHRNNEYLIWWRFKSIAFRRAKRHGGKVYRVRKLTAKREREAIVAMLKEQRDRWAKDSSSWIEINASIRQIEGMKHRRP